MVSTEPAAAQLPNIPAGNTCSPSGGYMKRLMFLSFGFLLLPSLVMASVYTCTDSSGGQVYQQTPCDGASSRAVRCVRSDGSTYETKGGSCPTQTTTNKPGLVTDVQTGRQHYMVPQGGNTMLDPHTGQRYVVTNPPREQRSMNDVCASERGRLDNALSHPKRTATSIRAAEKRWARFAGQC